MPRSVTQICPTPHSTPLVPQQMSTARLALTHTPCPPKSIPQQPAAHSDDDVHGGSHSEVVCPDGVVSCAQMFGALHGVPLHDGMTGPASPPLSAPSLLLTEQLHEPRPDPFAAQTAAPSAPLAQGHR
jgi:hypothetical protein